MHIKLWISSLFRRNRKVTHRLPLNLSILPFKEGFLNPLQPCKENYKEKTISNQKLLLKVIDVANLLLKDNKSCIVVSTPVVVLMEVNSKNMEVKAWSLWK